MQRITTEVNGYTVHTCPDICGWITTVTGYGDEVPMWYMSSGDLQAAGIVHLNVCKQLLKGE